MEAYCDDTTLASCNEILRGHEFLCDDDPLSMDLVNCFSCIFCADIANSRSGTSARNLCVRVKVDRSNLEAWKSCKLLIEQLARYVTKADGDNWDIIFIPYDHAIPTASQTMIPCHGNVALLSGGLDSFCGAYDVFCKKEPTLFVGYKNNNIAASKITDIFDFVQGKSGGCSLYPFEKISTKKRLTTQRTRSLLFLALAVASARKHSIQNVYLYENGIMTLNPSFQSRGTTKTTHPKTIMLFQRTLTDLGFSQKILHPYIFQTKGEMVFALDESFRQKIKDTHSCSKSRQALRYFTGKPGINSCGVCVPCLLRKISLSGYDMEKYDHEYSIPYAGSKTDEEYRSSLLYFTTFASAIKQGRIFQELDIRQKYYAVTDYVQRTEDMLGKFSKEVDIFVSKYGG